MKNYPDKDEIFFSNCENCPYPINVGDQYYDIDGNYAHIDCLKEYLTEKKVAVRKTAVLEENWIQTQI